MVYIDSGAFLGRYLRQDPYRDSAMRLWDQIEDEPLVTSNHVLDETFTLLARRAGYFFAADKAENIYESSAFLIVASEADEEREAIRFFRKFADQQVSFTDCVSFAIMSRRRIRTAFTFDRHFALAGFELLQPR